MLLLEWVQLLAFLLVMVVVMVVVVVEAAVKKDRVLSLNAASLGVVVRKAASLSVVAVQAASLSRLASLNVVDADAAAAKLSLS